MDVFNLLEKNLNNTWVLIGVATFIVLLGLIVSKYLSQRIINLVIYTPLFDFFETRIKFFGPASLIRLRIRQSSYILILILFLWMAIKVLSLDPQIVLLATRAWTLTLNFAGIPIVTFILNLLLIWFETALFRKIFRWTRAFFANNSEKIKAEEGSRLKGFSFQNWQILTAEQMTKFLLNANYLLRYVISLTLLVTYLGAVLSIFPQTRWISANIFGNFLQILSDMWNGFVNYLPNMLYLAIIITITYYILKFAEFMFYEIESGDLVIEGFHSEWAVLTLQLARGVIVILALVMAFPYLPGSSSPAFQGVSVFVGLLLSLGSTSVISNIVAGVVLTYTRAFRVGDHINVADTFGDVVEKGVFVTRLRTAKNIDVSIPNSVILGAHINNLSAQSQDKGMIISASVKLSHEVPWRFAHEILLKAATATHDVLSDPAPFILQTHLSETLVTYEINIHTKQAHRIPYIYSELLQNIQDFCKDAGIRFSS